MAKKQTWKDELKDHFNGSAPKKEPPIRQIPTKTIKSQECACGFWLGDENYSRVTKTFYCPMCSEIVSNVAVWV